MQKVFYKDLKLGILGGGQLGRMLIREAVNLNVYTSVLDPDGNAPCRNIANEFICGDLKDFDTVYNFGRSTDVLTIEIEHVNVDALDLLESEGVTVFPQPKVLRIVQDKGLQKQFYRLNNIPTAEFYLVENKEEIASHADRFPFFQKLRKGGYDGKGVYRLDSLDKMEGAFDAPSVLEKLVEFEKELAVIVGRNERGEVKCFPAAELVFNPQANLVELLLCPAKISAETAAKAEEIAVRTAEALGIVGILAVEMFLLPDGEILVNEIAPRPHNSGHHSIEANFTSQYMQHLRAILGLPLGSTELKIPAAMVNLLGEEGYSGEAIYKGIEEVLTIKGVNVHLYGKKYTKPFRKMGHITILDRDADDAIAKAMDVKNKLKIIS